MAALTWITLMATLIAAGAAVWLAFIGQHQVKIGQQQVAVSQEQVRQSLDAVYASRRPILMPVSALPLVTESNNNRRFDFQQAECSLALRNVGSGVAVNIRAVIIEPKPTPAPAPVSLTSRQTLWHGEPLEPQQTVETKTKVGMTIVSGDATIGKPPATFTLYAPPIPTPAERMQLDKPHIVARLTITCHDVYGRKHGSVFDFTDLGLWECVRFLVDIPKDIEDLDNDERVRSAEAQAEIAQQFAMPYPLPPNLR
jgi:hypothetical protein